MIASTAGNEPTQPASPGLVPVCARGVERLAATREEIARHGGTAHSAVCDLADEAAVPGYIEGAAPALGGIDILVNNASGFGATDDEKGWAVSVSVDLMATMRAIRAALPFLEKSASGTILNISSISGLRATPRTPPYAALKAAMVNYTLTEAAALARKASGSIASYQARSSFPAAPGSGRGSTTPIFTAGSSEAFRLGGSASRRK